MPSFEVVMEQLRHVVPSSGRPECRDSRTTSIRGLLRPTSTSRSESARSVNRRPTPIQIHLRGVCAPFPSALPRDTVLSQDRACPRVPFPRGSSIKGALALSWVHSLRCLRSIDSAPLSRNGPWFHRRCWSPSCRSMMMDASIAQVNAPEEHVEPLSRFRQCRACPPARL
ncbi:hypothetical protein Aduo_018788 [Ancylostoma duodenale]